MMIDLKVMMQAHPFHIQSVEDHQLARELAALVDSVDTNEQQVCRRNV